MSVKRQKKYERLSSRGEMNVNFITHAKSNLWKEYCCFSSKVYNPTHVSHEWDLNSEYQILDRNSLDLYLQMHWA